MGDAAGGEMVKPRSDPVILAYATSPFAGQPVDSPIQVERTATGLRIIEPAGCRPRRVLPLVLGPLVGLIGLGPLILCLVIPFETGFGKEWLDWFLLVLPLMFGTSFTCIGIVMVSTELLRRAQPLFIGVEDDRFELRRPLIYESCIGFDRSQIRRVLLRPAGTDLRTMGNLARVQLSVRHRFGVEVLPARPAPEAAWVAELLAGELGVPLQRTRIG